MIRAEYEYAEISFEEFSRRLDLARAELTGPALDEMQAHIRWFKRRYPTPLERLRYMRRKFNDWSKTRGILSSPR
jgi:hypothetical protein